MSNGDDVLDNWEEIDEAGLDSKLDKLKRDRQEPSKNQVTEHPQQQEQQQQDHQEQNDIAMSFQNSIPMMMVMQQNENEYKSSNYTTQSMPTVKILRRPAQQNSGGNRDNGIRPKQPIKTLQQREQEYAEARLRILGSAKNPEDDIETTGASASIASKSSPRAPGDNSNVTCSQLPSSQQHQPPPQGQGVIYMNSGTLSQPATSPSARPPPLPTAMVQNEANSIVIGGFPYQMLSGSNARYVENVLRMPRGPDETSGFQMRR